MISFLDSYLSLAKIDEIKFQSYVIHTALNNMWGLEPPSEKTLATARRERRARRQKK